MRAIKIVMRDERLNSNSPKDITRIYIETDNGSIQEFEIERLYNILMEHSNNRIYVNNTTAYLIPTCSLSGQKYVRSVPNKNTIDEIMKLPRC